MVTKKIVLADDHELVRKGIRHLIELHPEYNVVYEASHGLQVLKYLDDHSADLVLMDIEMPVLNGIDTVFKIKERYTDLPVMMLTMQNKPHLLRQSVAAGAIGYIHKNAAPDELHHAIEAAVQNQPFFSKEAMKILSQTDDDLKTPTEPDILRQITTREMEILKMVAEGYSSNIIGNKLFLSPQTVDTHRKNILKKLHLHSVRDLTRFALLHGLIS
jgi:two-component system response regulator NreC